jgi:hypothetical protein
MRTYEVVIVGAGPAGTGPLLWAAQHGLLSEWLDSGVAVVERDRPGGSLGEYALNADSRGTSFLECLDGPRRHPLLAEVSADPVTEELIQWREGRPTLALVDRFERRLGAALLAEFARHRNSDFFTGTTALAIQLEADGTVAVITADDEGRCATLRAASAVLAIGGQQNTTWETFDLAPEINLARWQAKILPSHQLLSRGGVAEVRRRLQRKDGEPRVVILGGAHSAFSAAWMLLEQIPGVCFATRSVQILYRSAPRITYPSRAEAQADAYSFSEVDVCQATGRVHRLGGVQGDGREVWRRMHGKADGRPDRRAAAGPLSDLSSEQLIRVLDDADLVVPALGYRMATIPVFSADGRLIPLASTGPAVGPESNLLDEDGGSVPGLFGLGLGSGFVPWGHLAGEASFSGQQNSLWLYQHGLGEMIYRGTRQRATQRDTKKRGFHALPIM